LGTGKEKVQTRLTVLVQEGSKRSVGESCGQKKREMEREMGTEKEKGVRASWGQRKRVLSASASVSVSVSIKQLKIDPDSDTDPDPDDPIASYRNGDRERAEP
jgi:hypothetical protein